MDASEVWLWRELLQDEHKGGGESTSKRSSKREGSSTSGGWIWGISNCKAPATPGSLREVMFRSVAVSSGAFCWKGTVGCPEKAR